MANQDPPENQEQKLKPRKDWILWSIVAVFIVLSVAGMWAIDFFYSPEMISPTTVPDAVGK